MNFDTYIAEAVQLDENRKRVGDPHYRQNKSLEWAIKDRNKLQFEVINNEGFTNVFGGTRLRYWEDGFQVPESPDGFFVVGVFYGDEVRYDMNGNEKKVIDFVAVRHYGKDKFSMAKDYAASLKKDEGAAFTNVFSGTKLQPQKQDDGKYTYVLPEAA